MTSTPFLDPNDFANGLSKDKVAYYWDENLKPTFNRAISGTYPPGSTFKPVTGVAYLSSEKAMLSNTVYCGPSAWVKPRAGCPRAHGAVNLYKAMAVSCNTYFQEMGYRTVSTDYIKRARTGLGQLTG